ncbi:hypothetical protein LTR35_008149 [Friedmanniomyces endolithicus]|uniref:FAD/NAD(P)-binding domain-containing protein n=1 Tax=Friedmanniomyces endolithicus TaxID=329885 RepID=A0AAN6FZR2_9PEZI|nr:hypothetical protein LTR35_008149 [Friedmanniomyces endolithicus]KAK0282141.1 hypothetical protein LTS00_012256 [Friedmanniomyces endolithicus]KAK0327472.1 hypothetical protein LTR82_000987 [Friedmanniomyces endolithicus]KAK1017961.1 hypothetical protein LTR54_001807 [Friedmanniomyces endolithicus]
MNGNDAVSYLNDEVAVTAETAPSGAQVHESTKPAVREETEGIIESDVLVIGAGFSGITAIDRFRKLGMEVKCLESGSDFGGVWYWNRYPGARVDSECPFYQLNIPEVYKDWHFTQRFSDHRELRQYMAHIDKTLNLRKDTYFNARVNDARWDEATSTWTVKTLQGHEAKAKYLILCTGLLHRTYTPDFQGIKDYKGEIHHSGEWDESFSARGKKIAIIGAGATAVQITQELGKQADELTVFLRRPSYCLPMRQRAWTKEEQHQWKAFYPVLFKEGRDSAVGFPTARNPNGLFDVSESAREALFDELWERGGFNFQLANFKDTALDKDVNKVVYDYWRRRVCERLTDPAKNAIMAPEIAPFYFGTKRSPLEQDYYEVLNQPNVHLHDLSKVPLKSFAEKGLVMADDKLLEFDAIVLATGFDSYTGSLTQMGIKSKDGVDLKDLWKDGLNTYLGITISGFPNAFMAYTPQAPTALSNGPTIIEAQVETIVAMVAKLESEGARKIEAKRQAEQEWKAMLDAMSQMTLIRLTDSWWNGANIPGKKSENMVYVAGINTYEKQIREKMDGWQGFDVVTAA